MHVIILQICQDRKTKRHIDIAHQQKRKARIQKTNIARFKKLRFKLKYQKKQIKSLSVIRVNRVN